MRGRFSHPVLWIWFESENLCGRGQQGGSISCNIRGQGGKTRMKRRFISPSISCFLFYIIVAFMAIPQASAVTGGIANMVTK
jgi:hypothetical protein